MGLTRGVISDPLLLLVMDLYEFIFCDKESFNALYAGDREMIISAYIELREKYKKESGKELEFEEEPFIRRDFEILKSDINVWYENEGLPKGVWRRINRCLDRIEKDIDYQEQERKIFKRAREEWQDLEAYKEYQKKQKEKNDK